MNHSIKGFDQVLVDIANYVEAPLSVAQPAYHMARVCLLDSLGCAMLALGSNECQKQLGSLSGLKDLPLGVPVPGTLYKLPLPEAVFNTSMLIRWLDYNDTWLAAEWGHPSDNIGAILSIAQWLKISNNGRQVTTIGDLLPYIIKAYEIQGVLALENAFNKKGLDHVVLVKAAVVAVVTHMLGGQKAQIAHALSQCWVDGQSLRTYRHAPNTGSRKCWAAADSAVRAVQFALMTMRGEHGYPTALSAPKWGFYDVHCQGQPFVINRNYSSYVIENILFKVAYPAEFHAQTIIECALKIRDEVLPRLDEIKEIKVGTHEAAMRIINKTGALHNPSDRDHCLQYICAIALLYGDVTEKHYLDDYAKNPEIDRLRDLMVLKEVISFSQDYLDPEKRSIANSLRVIFKDGSSTQTVSVEYPLGHRNRREEAMPLLRDKLEKNTSWHLDSNSMKFVLGLFDDLGELDQMPVEKFIELFKPRT